MRIRRIEIEHFRCIRERLIFDLGRAGQEARFAAIVGPNGSGKTSVLEAVAGVLRTKVTGFNVGGWRKETRIAVDSDHGTWEWTPSGWHAPERNQIANVLYVPAARDPSVPLNAPLSPGGDTRLMEELALATHGSATPTRVQTIHQWLMHQRFGTDVPELWQVVESFLEGGRYKGVDPMRHDLLFEFPWARVGFNELSGGQRSIILLLAEIVMQCGKNGLLIWDEPEAHLHPAWQRRLRTALPELLPDGQIIIATHSPFMVDQLAAEHLFILGSVDSATRAAG